MIIYCTSVTQSWARIVSYSQRLVLQIGSGSAELIREPAHLNHNQQFEWADTLLEMSDKKPNYSYVVASTSELTVLRMMRRIRDKYADHVKKLESSRNDAAPDFKVHALVDKGTNPPDHSVLHVDLCGEFKDVWPEGFFDGRMKELY